MRVIRHEENDKPCPITCNGDSPTAWSKTMIGYETEDKAYCFEVTYNYGVDSYKVGTGLASFSLAVDDVQAAVAAASKLGYIARNNKHSQAMIVGPDGYRFSVVAKAAPATAGGAARPEPFLAVRLHVSDVRRAVKFYTDVLRMRELPGGRTATGTTLDDAVLEAGDVAVGYGPDQVAVLLRKAEGSASPRIEQYEGRHAVSLPAEVLKEVYAKIEAESPELVVHGMMELEETLGTLFIAIVKDHDGFEFCLVSSETFDKAVLSAADWVEPDWALRATLIAERGAASIKAAEAASFGFLGGAGVPRYTSNATTSTPVLERAVAVGTYAVAALKEGEYAKSEGNFLFSGFAIGFFWVFGPLPVAAAVVPLVMAGALFSLK